MLMPNQELREKNPFPTIKILQFIGESLFFRYDLNLSLKRKYYSVQGNPFNKTKM